MRNNTGLAAMNPTPTLPHGGEGADRRNFTHGFMHRNIREGNKGSKNNGATPSPCGGGLGWGY